MKVLPTVNDQGTREMQMEGQQKVVAARVICKTQELPHYTRGDRNGNPGVPERCKGIRTDDFEYFLKDLVTREPKAVIATMQATTIRARTKAYSTAVGPSSRRSRQPLSGGESRTYEAIETQKTRAGRRGYLLAKKTPARRQIGISQNSGAEGSYLLRNLQLQARPGIHAFVGIPSFTIVVTSNSLQRL
jgi:hypothetical protein